MKKIYIRTVFGVFAYFILFSTHSEISNGILSNGIITVHAQQSVQYTYDSLGRVVSATYPDGTIVHYDYDRNGNLNSSTIQKKAESEESGGTTGGGTGGTTGGGTGETTGGGTGGTTGGETGGTTGGETGGTTDEGAGGTTSGETGGTTDEGAGGTTGEGAGGTTGGETGGTTGEGTGETTSGTTENQETSTDKQQPVVSTPGTTVQKIQIYNAFKKKKPVIKSLKLKKEKSKRYLKIQICKVGKDASEMELGYQIKYATNSKFKKAKATTVSKKKKKSITGKQWKVKKNKTYYVKVRAYMKTDAGKTIYTKYSKTKKIEVK